VLQVCITLFGLGLAIGLFWHAHPASRCFAEQAYFVLRVGMTIRGPECLDDGFVDFTGRVAKIHHAHHGFTATTTAELPSCVSDKGRGSFSTLIIAQDLLNGARAELRSVS